MNFDDLMKAEKRKMREQTWETICLAHEHMAQQANLFHNLLAAGVGLSAGAILTYTFVVNDLSILVTIGLLLIIPVSFVPAFFVFRHLKNSDEAMLVESYRKAKDLVPDIDTFLTEE